MALGKGLASLIPTSAAQQRPVHDSSEHIVDNNTIQQVKVTDIEVNPYQPRQQFSHPELEQLIASVKQHGILQPLVACKIEHGYQLIAGERRLRAARIAGLTTVPVIIREANEQEQLELALIENIQRADLNALEKAKSYQQLMDEFELNQEAAAEKLGISRSSFANSVRLLSLPEAVQDALLNGQISEGHAKILLGLPTAGEQLKQLNNILDHTLSVRALEQAVKGQTKQTHHRAAVKKSSNLQPHVKAWQDQLALQLSTKVIISESIPGKGTVTIHYFSNEELGQMIQQLLHD
jgi:ParB family chromosome partitioning protein